MLFLIASAAAITNPDFDRFDHTHPEAAVALLPDMGDRNVIEATARQIGGDTFDARLANIGDWMATHLRYDPALAYAWRDADEVLRSGRYGGCADYALVYGALSRALGIPTVWVKTMDVAWIRAFRAGPEPAVWSGHVFLEVHDGSRWKLLDPEAEVLYDAYDPAQRLLPGDRFAYDKGTDPRALVLSLQWEDWKAQTRDYFRTFDLSRLPVDGGRRIGSRRVAVVGDNPAWGVAERRLSTLGWQASGGNAGFDGWLPEAAGGTVVVLVRGGSDVLPEPWRSRYVGGAVPPKTPSWTVTRTAADGTRVVLVGGDDEAALEAEIGRLEL